MRSTFITTLIEQARIDERIFVITPDLGFSVLEKYIEEFPDRFLNIGIAEQNAIGVAAGLALSGKIVYIYSIIPFVTMRCFEQVRIDVAYMNLNVRLVGVGAGLSYGPAGTTHHAIEDIAIMRVLPNMTVCCPGDPVEVKEIVRRSFDHHGPMYIRLGKGGEPVIHPEGIRIEIGKAVTVCEGTDVVLLTTSNMLEQGRDWVIFWKDRNKSVKLVSMPTIKPIDKDAIIRIIESGLPIVTLEEHNIIGGLGSAVAEIIAEYGKPVKFKRIAITDIYPHFVGSQPFLRRKLGINNPEILF
jgi:transketolase